jgi:hypothetical protein
MNAGRMWFQLFLNILSHENEHWTDNQLLSQGADRLVEKHPIVGRLLILGAGMVITLHLANVLNERFDLMAASFWDRKRWTTAR